MSTSERKSSTSTRKSAKPAGAASAATGKRRTRPAGSAVKKDSKAKAPAEKAEVPTRGKDTVRETSETVQAKAAQFKDQAQAATAKAAATVTAKSQELGHQVAEKLPPQVRERVDQGVERASTVARQRPLPAAAVVALAVLLVWVLMRILRGSR